MTNWCTEVLRDAPAPWGVRYWASGGRRHQEYWRIFDANNDMVATLPKQKSNRSDMGELIVEAVNALARSLERQDGQEGAEQEEGA